MSVRMALAKLSACAAGCAIIGGGAVHVAEKQAAKTEYRKVKVAKVAKRPNSSAPAGSTGQMNLQPWPWSLRPPLTRRYRRPRPTSVAAAALRR
jgi:hypothetical protein